MFRTSWKAKRSVGWYNFRGQNIIVLWPVWLFFSMSRCFDIIGGNTCEVLWSSQNINGLYCHIQKFCDFFFSNPPFNIGLQIADWFPLKLSGNCHFNITLSLLRKTMERESALLANNRNGEKARLLPLGLEFGSSPRKLGQDVSP